MSEGVIHVFGSNTSLRSAFSFAPSFVPSKKHIYCLSMPAENSAVNSAVQRSLK